MYAQCIIVDEIVRANMHQRLASQCGWGLDYHVKRKIDLGPEDFLFFPDPKDYEIKGRDITHMSSAWFDGCIHY